MEIKLLVFDFDGVLADSFDIYREAYLHAFRAERIEIDEAELANSLGMGMKATIAQLLPSFEADPASLIATLRKNLEEFVLSPAAKQRYSLLPGVLEVLDKLDVQHPIPRVILSHSTVPFLSSFMVANDIDSHFVKIIGGDSGYENKAQALISLSEQFSLDPKSILFIADTTWDMQQGIDAGVTRVAIPGWHTIDMLASTQPDFLIAKLDDLLEILKK